MAWQKIESHFGQSKVAFFYDKAIYAIILMLLQKQVLLP